MDANSHVAFQIDTFCDNVIQSKDQRSKKAHLEFIHKYIFRIMEQHKITELKMVFDYITKKRSNPKFEEIYQFIRSGCFSDLGTILLAASTNTGINSAKAMKCFVDNFQPDLHAITEPNSMMPGNNCFLIAASCGNESLVRYFHSIDKTLCKAVGIHGENALVMAASNSFVCIGSKCDNKLCKSCEERLKIRPFATDLVRFKISMIDFLINECKVDLFQLDKNGRSCFEYAIANGHNNLIDYLFDADKFDCAKLCASTGVINIFMLAALQPKTSTLDLLIQNHEGWFDCGSASKDFTVGTSFISVDEVWSLKNSGKQKICLNMLCLAVLRNKQSNIRYLMSEWHDLADGVNNLCDKNGKLKDQNLKNIRKAFGGFKKFNGLSREEKSPFKFRTEEAKQGCEYLRKLMLKQVTYVDEEKVEYVD